MTSPDPTQALREIVTDLLGRLSSARPLSIGSLDSHREVVYSQDEIVRIQEALASPALGETVGKKHLRVMGFDVCAPWCPACVEASRDTEGR